MTFAFLELANGPKCPRCACRDAEILRRPTPTEDAGWFAQQGGDGEARCRNCGTGFTFTAEALPVAPPAVVDAAIEDMPHDDADRVIHAVTQPRDTAYPVRECPECGSPRVIVKSSPKPKPGMPKIRYHECRACGEAFKSVDSRYLKEEST